SSRLPFCFTTCGRRSSAVSYVVNRFPQSVHRRRRRMQSPSSPTLESTTCVSDEPQKGHFISLPVNRKFRRQRFHLALDALNHALIVRRIQEISDQIGELFGFQ